MTRMEDTRRFPADCACHKGSSSSSSSSSSSLRTKNGIRRSITPVTLTSLFVTVLISQSASVASFGTVLPASYTSVNGAATNTLLFQAAAKDNGAEDDISKQVERARALIAKSKAKIDKKNELALESTSQDGEGDNAAPSGNLPFFASKSAAADASRNTKMDQVIKSRDTETGLFVADGEKMAQLSEGEEWVSRPLLEVFENETEESSSSAGLRERDVAASIFNLRRQLQTEDYRRIFDTKNRFIGEDT